VLGCIEVPPSSSRLTAAFAPQLLLPTCRAISASPLPRGSRELAVRGSSELTASGRHLHTSSLCTSSPCMVILLPPVAEPALASALPRHRFLRGRPCQVIAVCGLVALRAGLSRAATPHLHPRTPEPRASLVRIALLLTRLNPPCALLLVPGRSPPLGSCSCAHTPTPPASAPCLLQPCRVIPAHPCSSAHSAPPRTRCSTRAPASPASIPAARSGRHQPCLPFPAPPPGACTPLLGSHVCTVACARICRTLTGSLCPRSNRAALHRRFPPPGSLPRASTLARATWACSCPGRATGARAANRASSVLHARSAHVRAEPPVLPVTRARAAHLRLRRSCSRPRRLASAQRLHHPAVALPACLRSPALACAPPAPRRQPLGPSRPLRLRRAAACARTPASARAHRRLAHAPMRPRARRLLWLQLLLPVRKRGGGKRGGK
jgi:hypothetical protein